MPEIEEEVPTHDDFTYVEHGSTEDFALGMKVCYVSNEYGDRPSNPLWGGLHGFIIGEVVETGWGDIGVDWETGHHNSYDPDDLLELIEK